MKKSLIYPIFSFLLFFSCTSETDTDQNSDKTQGSEESTSQIENIEVPDNPCDWISKELVTKHFNVSADSLEEDSYDREGVDWTEHCTYKWNKPDFEAINMRNLEKTMAFMKKGSTKGAVKMSKSLEKAQKYVGITNLRNFESLEKAQKYFKNSHSIPSKEDMKKLDKEFEKQSDKQGLSEDQKETGKSLAGGIADNMKFTEVDGIGDMAAWDDLGSKLDILVGTGQFGVKVHTGEGVEKDIEKAKAIAKDIIANF